MLCENGFRTHYGALTALERAPGCVGVYELCVDEFAGEESDRFEISGGIDEVYDEFLNTGFFVFVDALANLRGCADEAAFA